MKNQYNQRRKIIIMKKSEIGGYFRIIGNCCRNGYESSVTIQ
jgi:hypothetical protein